MFLKGVIKLKKGPAKITRNRLPWVYSNELEKSDTSIPSGSWVSLENSSGETLGYGHYNPHSLISFRLFETGKFKSEEQTRALFFKRLDWALSTRMRAYSNLIKNQEVGRFSFRLCFGESDGLPGLVVDLFETSEGKAYPVVQCHSAGADNFIFWLQQWFDERLGVLFGLVKNDIDVRNRENVKLEVFEWGSPPTHVYAIEGGVRFKIEPKTSQKTGYFYDLREHRAAFANRMATYSDTTVPVLDCFSFVGAWGLQVLKKNPKAVLTAVDISKSALQTLKLIAEENKISNSIETIEADFFKEKDILSKQKFLGVVMDPPSTSSSAKHIFQTIKAHEKCFFEAMRMLHNEGTLAMAACSYHYTRDEFLQTIARAAVAWNKTFKISHFGTQGADHPYVVQLLESNYIKCAIGEFVLGY